jgi:hypothetical protein
MADFETPENVGWAELAKPNMWAGMLGFAALSPTYDTTGRLV